MDSSMREDIARAVEVLERGGVILYPTDTIWGLGCDATNEAAVRRVYDIKHRADAKAFITLVDSEDMIARYVGEIPDIARELMTRSSRPLTLIYEKARFLAPNLLAADGSIAMRLTREAFSHALCASFKRPIVSTSANRSGEPSPATFDDIPEAIRQAVDYVCTSRRDDHTPAQPSTIIKLGGDGGFQIIRE